MTRWGEIKCPRCGAPPMSLWESMGRSLEEGDAREARLEARIEELEAKGLANRVAIMRLEAKLEKAVEGFEELARLGNGDRYGNSLGNLIAQEYLAELTGGKDE